MWQVIWASCWLIGMLLLWRNYARNLRWQMENVNKGPAHQYIWYCFWSQLSLKCMFMVPIALIIFWFVNANYYVHIQDSKHATISEWTWMIPTGFLSSWNPLFEAPYTL